MGWDVLIFPNLGSLMYFACIIEEIKFKYCSFLLTIGREQKKVKKASNNVLQTSVVLDGLKLLFHQCSCDTESVTGLREALSINDSILRVAPCSLVVVVVVTYLFISSRNNIRVSN